MMTVMAAIMLFVDSVIVVMMVVTVAMLLMMIMVMIVVLMVIMIMGQGSNVCDASGDIDGVSLVHISEPTRPY